MSEKKFKKIKILILCTLFTSIFTFTSANAMENYNESEPDQQVQGDTPGNYEDDKNKDNNNNINKQNMLEAAPIYSSISNEKKQNSTPGNDKDDDNENNNNINIQRSIYQENVENEVSNIIKKSNTILKKLNKNENFAIAETIELIDTDLKNLYVYAENLKEKKIDNSKIIKQIPNLIEKLKMFMVRLMCRKITDVEIEFEDEVGNYIEKIETYELKAMGNIKEIINKQEKKLNKFNKILEMYNIHFRGKDDFDGPNHYYKEINKRLNFLQKKIKTAYEKIFTKILNATTDESSINISSSEEENEINEEIEKIKREYKTTENFETLYEQYKKINEYIAKLENKEIKLTKQTYKLGAIKNKIKSKLKEKLNTSIVENYNTIQSEILEITNKTMFENQQNLAQSIKKLNEKLKSLEQKIENLRLKYGDFIKKDLTLNLDNISRNMGISINILNNLLNKNFNIGSKKENITIKNDDSKEENKELQLNKLDKEITEMMEKSYKSKNIKEIAFCLEKIYGYYLQYYNERNMNRVTKNLEQDLKEIEEKLFFLIKEKYEEKKHIIKEIEENFTIKKEYIKETASQLSEIITILTNIQEFYQLDEKFFKIYEEILETWSKLQNEIDKNENRIILHNKKSPKNNNVYNNYFDTKKLDEKERLAVPKKIIFPDNYKNSINENENKLDVKKNANNNEIKQIKEKNNKLTSKILLNKHLFCRLNLNKKNANNNEIKQPNEIKQIKEKNDNLHNKIKQVKKDDKNTNKYKIKVKLIKKSNNLNEQNKIENNNLTSRISINRNLFNKLNLNKK